MSPSSGVKKTSSDAKRRDWFKPLPGETIAVRVESGQTGDGRPQAFSRALLMLWLALLTLNISEPANAAEPALVIAGDAGQRRFTAAELLARPDCADLSVSSDIYHHTVTYRAVPFLSLVGSNSNDRLDTVEAQARDGFVSEIPWELFARGANHGAVAWLAVEDPSRPWPLLPHETESAGPFYLVWEHPERSGVTREQWPFKLIRLSFVESPVHQWPQLGLPAGTSDDHPAWRGQGVFVVQCLPCHRLNGGGASDAGPDLGRPMNPTQYLTEAGLRALIRNPRAVRTWPGQRMMGFDKTVLSENDLDEVVAYLRTMAGPIVRQPNGP
jgi:mono/diheme cytochrome c family protein